MLRPQPAARWRFLRRLLLGSGLALATLGTAGASPATDLYAAATREIRDNYYGWSPRNFRALETQYSRVLEQKCAAQKGTCGYSVGRAVLNDLLKAFGDEHTYVRDPESAALYRELEQAKPVPRSGVRVVRVEGGLLVVSVTPGSPAERLGVRRFDLFVRVDDKPAGRLNGKDQPIGPNEFARLERSGQPILVQLHRAGEAVDRTFTLSADMVPAPNLPSIVWGGEGGKVAVIELPSFLSADTAALFLKQVQQAQAAGVRKLIVDVRFNGGGSLQQCVAAASVFGPSIYNANYQVGGFSYSGLDGKESLYLDTVFASPGHRVWKGPAAVLIGPETASCAEVFGYYAQKNGAKLIGAPTKGVANSGIVLRDLPDGGMLAVTVFRGYAPEDVALPARLTPDVVAPLDLPLLFNEGRDTTLEAALSALRQMP